MYQYFNPAEKTESRQMGVPDKSAGFKQTTELLPENRPTEMSQHNTTN